MSQTNVCSSCHKEIQSNQSFCPYCGSPQLALLPSQTTTHIPEAAIVSAAVPERIVQLTRIYADILVFQVAGYEQPVLVKANRGQIIVGRYSPGEIAPALDLNPYNGSVLGVSRQHAVIIRTDEGYAIKDVGSTNGTWLNDVRLVPQQIYPLHSGDMIRAAQVTTNIYFRLPGTAEGGEISLTLKNEFDNARPTKLTVETLQTVLLPYLTALAGFQKVAADILGQSPAEVIVTGITTETAKATITVNMLGIEQVFRFLTMNIPRWREAYAEELRLKYVKSAEGGAAAPNDLETIPNKNSIRDALSELAQDILSDLLTDKSAEAQSPHFPKLLEHLETLAHSPLRFTSES